MTNTVGRVCAVIAVVTSLAACSAGTSGPPPPGSAAAARRSLARVYLRSADLPNGAEDYTFLIKAEGIRGASTRVGYKDWIDATGFAAEPASKGVDGSLSFTSLTSIASPPLVAYTYSGNPLQRVRLDVLRFENGVDRLFMSVELQGPVVASFQSTLIAGGGGLASGETFVLKATSVETCVATAIGKSCSTTTSM